MTPNPPIERLEAVLASRDLKQFSHLLQLQGEKFMNPQAITKNAQEKRKMTSIDTTVPAATKAGDCLPTK